MFDGKNYYTFKEQVSMQNMSGGELEGNPTGTPIMHIFKMRTLTQRPL